MYYIVNQLWLSAKVFSFFKIANWT